MEEKARLLGRIQRLDREFTPSEKRLARYILQRQSIDPDAMARDVARAASVSEATVSRFCKRLGLKGFKQLKEDLGGFTVTVAPNPVVTIEEDDDLDDVVEKTLQAFSATLDETRLTLQPDQLLRAATAIVQAEKVEFFAKGASGYMARHAAVRLMSLGIPSVASDLFTAQLASARMLGRDDVAFVVTHSGENPDALRLAATAREKGATVIALTSARNSRMARQADIPLVTAEWDLLPAAEAGPSRLSQFIGLEMVVSAVTWYLQTHGLRE